MKTNYPTKKLGEVVELNYGKGITKYDRNTDGRYPIYGANGELGRSDKYLVEGKAIVIGRKGSAGEVIRVSGKFWPSDVTYYVFGNKKIDIDFLFYLLKNINLTKLAVGVKPGINRNRVYEIEIPLPPLETQKKIVGKIEKMFAKIDEAQKLREEAKKDTSLLFQSTLNEIFSGPKAKKWEERKLKIICEIITDGTHISPDYTPTGISMLDSKNINDDFKIDDKNPSKFISLQTDRILSKKCKPKSDDVLLSSRGSIGKIAIVKKGQDFNIMGNMILLRPSDKLLAKFLANYMLFRTVEINNMAKGTSQRGLYLNQVRNFEIPVPPIVEQKKIVTRLDKLTEKVREMQKLQTRTAADMKNLKQSILAKAFKGELI